MSEIIDLLENALEQHSDECLLCALKDNRIIKVLDILKRPKCKTCEDTGLIECPVCYGEGRTSNNEPAERDECKRCKSTGKVPCPDCVSIYL